MQKKIVALYANNNTFSGQRFAIETVINGLSDRGWNVLALKLPALNRNDKIETNIFHFVTEISKIALPTLLIWLKVILSRRDLILYAGLGQTKFSLLREGLPIIIAANIKKFSGVIISLHGSDFMNWSNECFEFKIFSMIARTANKISVLGSTQYSKMISLNIPKDKLIIMDNTCLLPETSDDEIKVKHGKYELDTKLNVLFLSSLIEAKGYIQFVESIGHLAEKSSCHVEAILCGKTIFNQHTDRVFTSITSVRDWLKLKMEEINDSSNVRIQWIEGAIGEEKQKLFDKAHIFVLPTQYKTEAQPIVIIESLASGCAVITTAVGEIPGTVDNSTAIFLQECSPLEISNAIENLIVDTHARMQMALKGLELYKKRFSYTKHIDNWEIIFENMLKI
jgi:glycosyltransferase involved in cell wall biosynthesis